MDLDSVAFAAFVAITSFFLFLIYILGCLTYLPIPFFSYSQGKEKVCGRVSAIKKLKGGMTIEVFLDQNINIDPKLKERIVSSRVTYFAYFRKWQKIPKVGEIIVADIKKRNYVLRGTSLNWVKSWRRYAGEIPVIATIKLADHHNVIFSPS